MSIPSKNLLSSYRRTCGETYKKVQVSLPLLLRVFASPSGGRGVRDPPRRSRTPVWFRTLSPVPSEARRKKGSQIEALSPVEALSRSENPFGSKRWRNHLACHDHGLTPLPTLRSGLPPEGGAKTGRRKISSPAAAPCPGRCGSSGRRTRRHSPRRETPR